MILCVSLILNAVTAQAVSAQDECCQDQPPPVPVKSVVSSPLDPTLSHEEEAADALFDDFSSSESAGIDDAERARQSAGTGPPGTVVYAERSEDSEIFLELLLDDRETVLTSGLHAYLLDEETLVPLSALTELVDFPITVDTSRGTATGWFLEEDNTFSLTYPFKHVTIAGKKIPIREHTAEVHLDDIYVSTALISTWFPMQLTMNFNELRLYLKPLEELPFQARAQRRSRWGQAKQKNTQPGVAYDPDKAIELPYRMFSAPSVTVTQAFSHNAPGSAKRSSNLNHSFNAQNDLLGMSARSSLTHQLGTGSTPDFDNFRLTLSKDDLQAKLLGPLRATHFELGDVNGTPFPMTGTPSGRGFTIDNEPYNFVRDATQFRIEGFGPAGWDVEVFQDLELLDFQTIAADGRYSFTALPLSEGFNLFKIVLYGPNGEKEERFERFYLGQNMIEEGKFVYSAAMIQSSSPLLNVSKTDIAKTDPTISLLGEYGLTKYLSVGGGYYKSPLNTTQELDGFNFGLRASGGNSYAQMNTFFDKTGGQSSSVLIAGNLTPKTTFNLQHRMNRGYDPGVYATIRSMSAQISRLFEFKNDILPGINSTMGVSKEESDTGLKTTTFSSRTAANFLGMSLSNEMKRTIHSDGTQDLHDGRLSLRRRSPFGTLRASASYTFHDPAKLTLASLDYQKDLSESVGVSASLSRAFDATRLVTLRSTLDWQLEKVRLGFTGSYNSENDKQIGMTMTYTLLPRSLYGDYEVTSRAEDISSGRLLLRPFIDENQNGKWDEGERIVEDLRFKNLLRGSRSTVGANGMPLVTGLTPALANRIVLEPKSIKDIYLISKEKEILVMGKNGVNGPLDFPFIKLGYISGSLVTRNEDGEDINLENVHIVLLDQDGKQAAETWSEYDGYFIFDALPTGTYEMFFPASAPLRPHYAGSGEGPVLKTTFAEPALDDIVIRIEPDDFIIDNAEELEGFIEEPSASGPAPTLPRESRAPLPRLPVFAMNLSPIAHGHAQ
ncbi:MAG: carboxypeptidase-like regulatory domain-containing protein [Alphaproteobacteria bacterium]|nr:carboxypeptidase-like regulatory domain-containing protein [Alphaproteobacteria bacterium]